MARHAANAITRQRAIDIRFVFSRIVSRVNQLAFEVTFIRTTVIVVQTAFTHHAMTLEARVIDGIDLFRDFRRIVFEESFYKLNLAIELCVEDWIAASQTHRRPAPLAEG